MVQNILKKEEEDALKILKGGKEEKKEKKDEKKVERLSEDEILAEFVPSIPRKPVSPFLQLDKKNLEEHAEEVVIPKKEEEKKEIKYQSSQPMYGERGYEERKEQQTDARRERPLAVDMTPLSMNKRPEMKMFRPPEMESTEPRDVMKYERESERDSGLPFMKKEGFKKYKRR